MMDHTIFPCIEHPLRVTLRCKGYYLWSTRTGRVIARKRRSEKDEFRLCYEDAGLVTIQNHKFGGYLSVLEQIDGRRTAMFISEVRNGKNKEEDVDDDDDKEEEDSSLLLEKENGYEEENQETKEANSYGLIMKEVDAKTSNEIDSSKPDINGERAAVPSETTEDCKKWCLVQGAHGNVVLRSLKTGDILGFDNSGNLVLNNEENFWSIDCVTGELCFLSNPALDCRIRCDMAGSTTLSSNWKGWEVFRLMEASHGYVKISSWMHSQWLLCSTADGRVKTCSHAEASNNEDKGCCSKWAVEKSLNGVVIRSKMFGRFLSVNNGILKTYHEDDDIQNEGEESTPTNNEDQTAKEFGPTFAVMPPTIPLPENTSVSAVTDKTMQKPSKERSTNWWSNNLKLIQKEMKEIRSGAQIVKQKIKPNESQNCDGGNSDVIIAERETIIWNLEAAHLQTYYFSNVIQGEKPKSIGPFPKVTPDLRKTEKLQLLRKGNTTKLCNAATKQYVACSSDGTIKYVDNFADENTEWIMEKPAYQDGASVFRSIHDLYLSYEDTINEEIEQTDSRSNQKDIFNLFNKKDNIVGKLVGAETIGEREVWRLDPCMPRAVSSEKIKIFAIGTSIAVGTTIALPFALAGVGALLGAVGAEVGIVANVIAAGLTGVEAIASIGAIGATAYIVFRPDDNSLTDDHQKEDDEAEKAWSKRPFSNWRNW